MGLLLISFIVLMIIGAPIAVCMFGSSLLYLITNSIDPIVAVQRLLAGTNSFVLLSVPGFMLAASIMNTGGITTRIFNFADKCVGHITGGMGHANVLASVIFAGMSGSATADAAGLGAIELKAMREANYPDDFSVAVTGASAIIGPIIPPSVPMVIFGVASSQSVGRLFLGGVIPGLIMAMGMSAYIYIHCKRNGYKPGKRASLREIWDSFKHSFWSLMAPAFILGSIVAGIVTPTEAAVTAVVYAIIVGFCYKSIKARDIWGFLVETTKTIGPVLLILSSASLFAYILALEQVPQQLANLFLSMTDNKYVFLIIVNILLLIVGCFMDNSAAIIILTPVFMPILPLYGIDPIHFGVIVVINLMIGFLTPPVGMGLYVLSVVSKVRFESIVKCMIPYIIILSALLLLFTYVPQIVTFLPNLLLGG